VRAQIVFMLVELIGNVSNGIAIERRKILLTFVNIGFIIAIHWGTNLLNPLLTGHEARESFTSGIWLYEGLAGNVHT